MKALIINMLLLNFLVACNKKDDNFDPINPDVKKFVELVKKDKYDLAYLPNFVPNDIPTLLKYADDFSVISKFPVNPISSIYPERLTVGECLLWTIESIRLKYDVEDNMLKFPSLVPQLIEKENTNKPFLDNNQLIEVYILYKDWWYNNIGKDFELTREINPLEDSMYLWK